MKTAIIGLDGGTYRIIDNYREDLPTLDRLMADGYHSILDSTQPPTTSVAWPSFATGQNPAKYGMFDFMGRFPETLNFYINDARKKGFDFFWEHMDEPIGLGSVPLIPYHNTDGFFVQGSLARINEDQIVSPISLKEIIPDYYDYRINWQDDTADIVDGVMKRIAAREEFFKHLISTFDIPLYFLMFNAIDHIQHHFWAYMHESHPAHEDSSFGAAILDAYKRFDEALENILACFDERVNVVIASDHGFKPCHTELNINALLNQKGYLEYDVGTSTAVLTDAYDFLKNHISADTLEFLIPSSVKSAAKDQMPRNDRIMDAINWTETSAYSFGVMPNIYLNLVGREKYGQVSQAAYDQICDELTEMFLDVTDPKTGKNVFKNVYQRDDIYHGPYIEQAPDLVLETTTGFYCSGNLGTQIFTRKTGPMPNSGVHEREGILIANGPDIATSDGRAERNGIADVAPTLLHLLGYPIPENMDGTVILGLDTSDRTPAYTDHKKSEKKHVESRVLTLKQLGRI
ncbi:alkaline phosphatase family protein [Haloarcula brevis]|uniref:alkaline phosphatase family protein n=1 Tax=Haloarcula brevis TaxID=3111453 RepID=UPI00300F33D7